MIKKFFTLLCLCVLCIGSAWGDYVKVTEAPEDWSGEYLLVYENGDNSVAWTGVDAASCNVSVTISNRKISEKPEKAVTITIAPMTGGYSIKVNGGDNDGKFIKGTSGNNALGFETTAQLNTISYDTDNNGVLITSNTSVMRYNPNASNYRFRYFKSTSYSSQKIVQLYKYENGDTPSKTLESIAISGNPTKTTYKEGESFDPAGLVVTGTYDDSSTDEITNGIVWSSNPETLSLGTTSVSVTAKVNEIESNPYNVNVTVTEKIVLPSYTLVTDASTLIDGDVIVLGAVKDEKWYANAGINTKFLDAAKATCTDNTLESEDAVEIELEKCDGGWYLKIGDKYINTTIAKALTFADNASTSWTITIDESNKATVSAGDYGRFLYNYNNGSPRFLNYTSNLSVSMLLPQIFKKKVQTQDVEITSVGFATAYIPFAATISNKANDVKAYYVTVSGDKAKLNEITGTIPANTGIVLQGTGNVTFTESKETPASVDGNLLIGTTKAGGENFEETDYTYYILSNGEKGVGFYWDGEYYPEFEGMGAHCAQYKAVLAVPGTTPAKCFLFDFDEPSGINNVNATSENGSIYNLQGVRVSSMTRGNVYIQNGKKFMFNK